MKDRATVLFQHSHKDPSSTALNIVKFLKTRGRDPKNECIAVYQPWTSVLLGRTSSFVLVSLVAFCVP